MGNFLKTNEGSKILNFPFHRFSKKQKEIFRIATDLDNGISVLPIVTGRQVGKSTIGRFISMYMAFKESDYEIGFFEPTHKQCKNQFKKMLKNLKQVRKYLIVNRTDLSIEFPNGSVITFLSAFNEDSQRGYTFDYIIVDEACFIQDNIYLGGIEPTVKVSLSKLNGKAILLSTPRDKNWFYTMYNIGNNKEDKDIYSIKFTTEEGGIVSPREIAKAKKLLPAAIFENEYLAEFSDGGGGLFAYGEYMIDNLVKYKRGVKYVGAIDWGLENDSTVLTIQNIQKEIVYIERINGQSYRIIIHKLINELKKFGNPLVYSEVNGVGQMPTQELKRKYKNVVAQKTLASNKEDMILKLIEDIAEGIVRIPKHKDYKWLRDELDNYRFEIKNGRRKYNAAHGFHDDGVMSLAICNYNCKKTGLTVY